MVPTHNLLEFLVTVYALILREWLGSSPRRLERLTAGGGVALIGLGVGLAITGRKH
jgi:threonine/homoserine/homoserine lactone efflux protein